MTPQPMARPHAAGRACVALILGSGLSACVTTGGTDDIKTNDGSEPDADSDTNSDTHADSGLIAQVWLIDAQVAGSTLTGGHIGLGFVQVTEAYTAPYWNNPPLCATLGALTDTGALPAVPCPGCLWSFEVTVGSPEDEGEYCAGLSFARIFEISGPYGIGLVLDYPRYYAPGSYYDAAILMYTPPEDGSQGEWFPFMYQIGNNSGFYVYGDENGVDSQRPRDQHGQGYYFYRYYF